MNDIKNTDETDTSKHLFQHHINSDDSGIEDGPDSLPSSIEDQHNGDNSITKPPEKNEEKQIGKIGRSKTFSIFGRLFNKKSYEKYLDGKPKNFSNKSQTLPKTSKELKNPFKKESTISTIQSQSIEEIESDNGSETGDDGDTDNSESTDVKDIGIMGLHNVDNSCYINSILQCLSHIDLFAEYFARDVYKSDFTTFDKDKDMMTSSLSKLFKVLWQPQEKYNVDLYLNFLKIVGTLNNDFSHGDQQDAQEFFMWLIDRLHYESMDHPTVKKSKSLQKKKKGRTDAEQAVLAFASYTDFFQSYIQSLFISQYRSSIKCSYCNNYSNTYDPYLCISLSIPPNPEVIVFITIYFKEKNSTPVKLSLTLARDEKISCIRNSIEGLYKDLKHFVMIRMKTNGLFTYVNESNYVSSLPLTENSLHIIELSCDYIENRQTIRPKEFINTEQYIHLVISNVEIYHKQKLRFGSPYAMNVSYDLPFKDLQSLLVSRMPHNERTFVARTVKQYPYSMRWRLINRDSTGDIGKDDDDYMITSCEYPLHDQATYRNFIDHEIENVRCLFVLVEWEAVEPAWRFRTLNVPTPKEDISCEEARVKKNDQKTFSLNDCLELQTQEEKLPSDIGWRCEFCRKKQEGLSKKLSLWSLPDILVFHLKRFDQYNGNDGKISSVVEYPVEGLNMFRYIVSSSDLRLKKTIKKASIRLNYQPPPENEEDCIYDLKGVCNHLGRYVNTGHYTSFCKNSFDNEWYSFDDRCVRKIHNIDDVISSDAYLLFYQRRNVSDVVKKRNCNMMSSSCSNQLHWSRDIGKFDATVGDTENVKNNPVFQLAI